MTLKVIKKTTQAIFETALSLSKDNDVCIIHDTSLSSDFAQLNNCENLKLLSSDDILFSLNMLEKYTYVLVVSKQKGLVSKLASISGLETKISTLFLFFMS